MTCVMCSPWKRTFTLAPLAPFDYDFTLLVVNYKNISMKKQLKLVKTFNFRIIGLMTTLFWIQFKFNPKIATSNINFNYLDIQTIIMSTSNFNHFNNL
jgi:hypothetical protein